VGNPRTVYVVLPAYNEGAAIGAVLEALSRTSRGLGAPFQAVVVDDGSSDDTPAQARSRGGLLPVTLIVHDQNQGLGAAIRDGLLRAVDLASNGDVVVTMDADDTHAPAAIAAMLDLIDRGDDVVIASRYRAGSESRGVPPGRRLLSFGASLLLRALFPTRGVRDFTCGYRAYRASALRRAVALYRKDFITQDGFQCMVDILLKLRRMELRFSEVPLVLRYDKKPGKSKMKVGRTLWRTLVLVGRRRLGL
jgi:dolichol-phosphate mannosyltransferase